MEWNKMKLNAEKNENSETEFGEFVSAFYYKINKIVER